MDPKDTPPATPAPEPSAADLYDSFTSAFDEATEHTPEKPPEPTPPPDDAAAPPPADPAPAAPEPAAAAPAAPAQGGDTSPPPVDEWKAKYEALQAELAAKAKEPEPPKDDAKPADEPKKAEKAPEIKWYTPAEEEMAAVKEFEKEWPEIAKAEGYRRKADNYNLVQYVFAEVSRVYDAQLARMQEMIDALSDKATIDTIRTAHNDYETIYDDVVSWAKTLPSSFRIGALQTMEQGTPEEVSELIAEYKKQKGLTGKAGVPQPSEPKDKEPQLSAVAKKAAQSLQVVQSRRTAPASTASDPNDFEGAWKEAVGG
jgi:hypothetical protein